MLKKNFILIIVALTFNIKVTYAQPSNQFKKNKELLQTIAKNFNDADRQYKLLISRLPAGKFPKTFYEQKDSLETSGPGWWCSGFFPGTLFYLCQSTGDSSLMAEGRRLLSVLAPEQYNTTTHDLGFMMYCSFGNALKIKPDSNYTHVLINSAKSLSTRFDPKVGCIRSWDSKKSDYLVIIDNMMNLELLFFATKATGDSSFYRIAVTHANTTMKNHFRPNYSSYHVVNYNPQTGMVQQKRTAQGYSNESAWARGQAWGLYGYTVMYRETHDKKYLTQACDIADFVLNNPNLPVDKIPYWDFNAPNIPNALKDASAAAVMASGLLELCGYTTGATANKYFSAAEIMLKSLSSPRYKSTAGTNGGFLLKHSVGNMPQHSEIDVPLTYADYYFVEAMQRYQRL